MLTQRGEQLLQLLVVQFLFPLAGPLVRFWGPFSEDGVGDIVEVLFGVAAVQDLGGAGKQLIGDVPVIDGAVGEGHHPVGFAKTATSGFSPDALGKF